MGGRIVVINGYKHVREALVQKGDDLADRPVIPLFDEFVRNRGSVICVLYEKMLVSNTSCSSNMRLTP